VCVWGGGGGGGGGRGGQANCQGGEFFSLASQMFAGMLSFVPMASLCAGE